jgi:hypothetical protein
MVPGTYRQLLQVKLLLIRQKKDITHQLLQVKQLLLATRSKKHLPRHTKQVLR